MKAEDSIGEALGRQTDLDEEDEQFAKTPTVMVLDDQARIRKAFAKRLEARGLNCVQKGSGEEALAYLDDGEVDLLLLDIKMPGMNGFEVLETLRVEYDLSELPAVMLTRREDEGDILRALKLGANDYVTKKTDFKITLARIQTQLRLKFATDRVVKLSRTDELTGLLNSRAFYERLGEEHERFKRAKSPYSLLMLDIDHFKEVNDTFGHLAGDQVLRGVAYRIESTVREVDIPCRFGGEEFVVLLPETDHEGAKNLAERLCRRIAERPFSFDEEHQTITASLGVATQEPGNFMPYEELLDRADKAMYRAKRAGRNCVRGNGTES